MLELLSNGILKVMDVALGWLLALPSDVAIFVVAVGSAAILTGVRVFTTNQEFLRRVARDKKRLKALRKAARKAGDREAVKRYAATMSMVTMKGFKCEGRPLLAAIVPIALLAVWCFARLGYHPPKAGEPVRVVAYFPWSAVGRLTHVAPQDGLRTADGAGWVRRIGPVTDEGPPHGTATWTLLAEAREDPYALQLRYGGETYTKQLLVGQGTYAPPVEFYDQKVTCAEVVMEPVKLFGVVPGWGAALPGWMVAYLIIVLPAASGLKRLLRIC